jgi:hypothetical protein
MRQASWIAFLLLTLGLVTYEASLDAGPATLEEPLFLDGGTGVPWPDPKP